MCVFVCHDLRYCWRLDNLGLRIRAARGKIEEQREKMKRRRGGDEGRSCAVMIVLDQDASEFFLYFKFSTFFSIVGGVA